jgi:hypothetical protein
MCGNDVASVDTSSDVGTGMGAVGNPIIVNGEIVGEHGDEREAYKHTNRDKKESNKHTPVGEPMGIEGGPGPTATPINIGRSSISASLKNSLSPRSPLAGSPSNYRSVPQDDFDGDDADAGRGSLRKKITEKVGLKSKDGVSYGGINDDDL